jgi:hypothetical protein
MKTAREIRTDNQRYVTAVLARAVYSLGVTLAAADSFGHCMVCGEKADTPHWHTQTEMQAGADRESDFDCFSLPVTADMGS